MDEHAEAHRRPVRTHFGNIGHIISINGGFVYFDRYLLWSLKLTIFLPQFPYCRDCRLGK